MKINLYRWLADAPLSDPETLNQQPADAAAQNDPLIAHGWTNTASISVIFLVLGIAVAVGVFSRKIEYAVVTALVLSVIPIVLLVFTGH